MNIKGVDNFFIKKSLSSVEQNIDKQTADTVNNVRQMFQTSLLDLDDFCKSGLPQLQDNQEKLLGSLEKLAQNAKIYKK